MNGGNGKKQRTIIGNPKCKELEEIVKPHQKASLQDFPKCSTNVNCQRHSSANFHFQRDKMKVVKAQKKVLEREILDVKFKIIIIDICEITQEEGTTEYEFSRVYIVPPLHVKDVEIATA